MANFTPGPWTREHSRPDSECNKSIAYINSPSRIGLLEIATVYSCDVDPEQDANANLIASAPDLLTALKLSTEELENYLADARGFDDRNDLSNLIATNKAAIGKVEGK